MIRYPKPAYSHVTTMYPDSTARVLLAQEARALLTRIERLSPFALKMPMVSAAMVSPTAQTGAS